MGRAPVELRRRGRRWLLVLLAATPSVTAAGTVIATSAPYDCELQSAPPLGPPGTVVEVTGQCYPIHSGRSADVYFDDQKIGRVSGETGGNFCSLVRIPADAAAGPHELRIDGQSVRSTTPFEVTHARVCVGDCDQSGLITIDELITGVAIAHGQRPLEACYDFDPNWDASVRVNELVAGIAGSLTGCTPAPELFAFAGAYTAAISQAEEFSPSAVHAYAGLVAGSGSPALLIDVAYWPGVVRASTVGLFDAAWELDGTFMRTDRSTSDVSGEASAVTDGEHWWVSGTLTLAPLTDDREEVLYFVMTRRDE